MKPQFNCISCAARAVVISEDGAYCKPCMQLHIFEKMLVNLTKMHSPKKEKT